MVFRKELTYIETIDVVDVKDISGSTCEYTSPRRRY